MAGVCAAHAVKLPDDRLESILFYQSHEHPERQPAPQPYQENERIAVSTSVSAIADDSSDADWWMSVLNSMDRARR